MKLALADIIREHRPRSDNWPGLETFFELEKEILTSSSAEEVLVYLKEISENERRAIGERARRRVLASHTSEQRALELESYVGEVTRTTPEPVGAMV